MFYHSSFENIAQTEPKENIISTTMFKVAPITYTYLVSPNNIFMSVSISNPPLSSYSHFDASASNGAKISSNMQGQSYITYMCYYSLRIPLALRSVYSLGTV